MVWNERRGGRSDGRGVEGAAGWIRVKNKVHLVQGKGKREKERGSTTDNLGKKRMRAGDRSMCWTTPKTEK